MTDGGGDRTTALMDEARSLGLFRIHGAFEVHCSNCHARLDGSGNCPDCGLIGRSEEQVSERAKSDPAATDKLLRTQIDRRRAHRPVRTAGRDQPG